MRSPIWIVAAVAAFLLHDLSVAQAIETTPSLFDSAKTFIVTTQVDENDGQCIDTHCSLREAVIAANAVGTGVIRIPAGHYVLTLDGQNEDAGASGDLDIHANILMVGDGMSHTILDGNTLDRVFHIQGGESLRTVVLRDLTIRGGMSADGGGILVEPGAALTIENCWITENTSENSGGGIAGFDSAVTLAHSFITGNMATIGGGMATSGGELAISQSTIAENAAVDGGGLYAAPGAASRVVIDSTSIFDNHASGDGGGMMSSASAGVITNTTVSGNGADGHGGGLSIEGGSLKLHHTTITNNAATGSGSGIYSGETSVVTLTNSLVAQNQDHEDCWGTVAVEGAALLGSTSECTLQGATSGVLIGVDARLNPLQDNGGLTYTHGLQPDSPAIDAGSPDFCLSVDQRGVNRPQRAACDLGAYEALRLPAAPASLAANLVSNDTVQLSWRDNSVTETGFIIEISRGGSPWSQLTLTPANTTTYQDDPVLCGSTIAYRVRSYRGSDGYASAPTSTVTVTTPACMISSPTPSPLQWISPVGTISDGYGNPRYSWTAVPGVTQYELMVKDQNNTQVIREVIDAAAYCSGETCSIEPTTLRESYRLVNGTYQAYIRSRSGQGESEWLGPVAFVLAAPPPGTVTLESVTDTSTLRPTFRWNLRGTAANATWFRVRVVKAETPNVIALDAPGSRISLCGGANGLQCRMQSPTALENNTRYSLYIQSYGPGGLNSQFAGPLDFMVNAAVPTLPAGLNVVVEQSVPVISWSNDPAAAWYEVYIGRENGSKVYQQWHQRTPELCSEAGCRLLLPTSLNAGRYQLFLRAWGAGGFSTDGLGGWAGPVSFTIESTAPGAVFSLAVANASTGRPTFSWARSEGATHYQIWIGTFFELSTYHQQWYSAVELGCDQNELCTLTPNINLPNGDYTWFVQAASPGGVGEWSPSQNFTVAAERPGTVVLGSPAGVITQANPVFDWGHLPGVTYYQFWLGSAEPRSAIHLKWYSAAELGCEPDAICLLTIADLALQPGDYVWYVQAYNPAGVGEWSAEQPFTVAP